MTTHERPLLPTRAIWRFTSAPDVNGLLWITDWVEGARPLRAEVISADVGIQVWAEVPDVDARRGAKLFEIIPTGGTMDPNAEYVDTFTQEGGPNNGRWIWHLLHYPSGDSRV